MKIGFIGTGNMAQAIIQGMISKETVSQSTIFISSGHYENAQKFAQQTGVNACKNNLDVVKHCDIVILSVKPAVLPTVLKELQGNQTGKLFISIAAGTTLRDLESYINDPHTPFIRVMPNVNVSVGEGVSAICKNSAVSKEQEQHAQMIFSSVGSVYPLAEKDFSTFIGLAGSSPAFIYMLIDAMGRAGVLHGLPKHVATEIAAKAVLGSAKKLLASDKNPWTLVDEVSSPGGTTVAGVVSLEEAGFTSAIIQGISETIKKDIALLQNK